MEGERVSLILEKQISGKKGKCDLGKLHRERWWTITTEKTV